ncbi:FAD-dependent thymidylate synthase [Cupriavidus metallidurans]|uniref:FAD-dependent thymidylate synthase n=1 Tax=Cupriavidus metallidurans TaxID=119219 RepID=UPI001CCBBE4D|nr:FAD-dependent thymidylate synthase [Cupriavidus metallidurans]UBM12703.1 FAD-dependent thymidylate synthase [Cupriavidus metallidurans]
MTFEVKVIEDSISHHGVRLTTLQLRYPRLIHAEFMTHRVFSRNASSSRAIPVAKMIEQVRTNPAMPIHWGKNQPGMQAHEELTGSERLDVIEKWHAAARFAAGVAAEMSDLGAHKQVVNRILEPFQWISTLVTATEWANFFELRAHPDAQPEIHHLAKMIQEAMGVSIPFQRCRNRDDGNNWHLPYVLHDERRFMSVNVLRKLSAARCARVSYLTHDGATPNINKDLELFDRLVGSHPLHASPVEHQAYPLPAADQWSKNFRGWRQFREYVEIEQKQ